MKKILKIIGIIIGTLIAIIILLNVITISWGFYRINEQKNNIPETKSSANYYKNYVVISKFDSTNEKVLLPSINTNSYLITTDIFSESGKPIKFLIVKKDFEIVSRDCVDLISRCFLTSEINFETGLNFSFNFDQNNYKVLIPKDKMSEITDTNKMFSETENFLK